MPEPKCKYIFPSAEDNLDRKFIYVPLIEAIKASENGVSVLWRTCNCRPIPCGCPKETAILEWEVKRVINQPETGKSIL